MTKLAFVCEGNAGRSQLAAALAERESDRRGLDVEVVTGGIDPADSVHEETVEVLAERGVDIGDRAPRQIEPDDVVDAEYVVTMGCTADRFVPAGWDGTAVVWDLDHSNAGDVEGAREQRDEIERRVRRLFDEFDRD